MTASEAQHHKEKKIRREEKNCSASHASPPSSTKSSGTTEDQHGLIFKSHDPAPPETPRERQGNAKEIPRKYQENAKAGRLMGCFSVTL
ncbi:hypothetical protein ACO22_08163 [Paracoccidioides brasiliensis]|uniref:Uncharacterized protein n=1 Tax=Paracoccidioides brasiliensis TaxID=121759 RepID=A0A1D2J2L7_PARBR|nr:hypothetical protein ACO22_08163 [Paracoccidioides brasiliensis]